MSDEYYETHDPIANKERRESFIENIPGIIGFSVPIFLLIFVTWLFVYLLTYKGEEITDEQWFYYCINNPESRFCK